MKKILIISASKELQQLIEGVAQKHEKGVDLEFETTPSFGHTSDWWAKNSVQLLIVDLPPDELLETYYFLKLKQDVPRNTPVLMVSPQISQALLQLGPLFQRIRILKSPVDAAVLYRAVLDATSDWGPGQKQIHPRYMTEFPILIQRDGDSKGVQGRLKNISVGGAYFEVHEKVKQSLQPTDLVQIQIQLPNSHSYSFQARVVWSKKTQNEQVGFGCTFTDLDEVYRNLMRGV